MPTLVGSQLKYCHEIWCTKTRIVWLSDVEKTLMICLPTSTQYRRVTDRWTDILRRQSPCYAYGSCGKIVWEFFFMTVLEVGSLALTSVLL